MLTCNNWMLCFVALEIMGAVSLVTGLHQHSFTHSRRRNVRNSDEKSGTDHHKAMEDQIRAVFSKVAYDFGHFNPAMQAPSALTTQKSTTTAIRTTSTTLKPHYKGHKIYINSPKVYPDDMAPSRKPSTHRQIVVTPFPNFEWFTKDSLPSVRYPPKSSKSVTDDAKDNSTITPQVKVKISPRTSTTTEMIKTTREPKYIDFEDSPSTKQVKPTETFDIITNNDIPIQQYPDKSSNDDDITSTPTKSREQLQPHPEKESNFMNTSEKPKYSGNMIIPYVEPLPEWEKGIKEWGIAWQLHIYILGILFLMLAVYTAYSYRYVYTNNRIISRSYFCVVNTFLFILGITRAFSFFYDAYNIKKLLPPILAQLLFNIASPCLTSSFATLLIALTRTLRTKIAHHLVQNSLTLTIIVIVHLTLSVSCDIVVGSITNVRVLVLVCFLVYVGWLCILTFTYFYIYRKLLSASVKLKSIMMVERYSKLQLTGQMIPRRIPPSSYVLAIRVVLGVSLLGLALVIVLLYGLFGLFGILSDAAPDPWQWWVYQFIVRMLEVLMTYLMAFVISLKVINGDCPKQKRSYGMSVMSLLKSKNSCAANTICGGTSGSSLQTDNIPDNYPTMCNINQSVQKHELYGGQSYAVTLGTPKVDIYRKGWARKSNTLISVKSDKSDSQYRNNTLPNSRPSSMLCADQGFVRFRSKDDPEQPMEHVLRQTTLPKSKKAVPNEELPSEFIDKCLNLIPPHVYEELYYYNSARKRDLKYNPPEGSTQANDEDLASSRLLLEKIKSITKSSSEQTCSAPYYYPSSSLRDSSDRMPSGPSPRGSSETCSMCRNESPCSSQSAAHSFDVHMYYRKEPDHAYFHSGQHHATCPHSDGDYYHNPIDREPTLKRNVHPLPHSDYADPQCKLCNYDRSEIQSRLPSIHNREHSHIGPSKNPSSRKNRMSSSARCSDSDIASSDDTSRDGSLDADDEQESPSNDPHLNLNLKLTRSIDLADHYCVFEQNPNSTDITPDSAVVSDLRDSPHRKRNPIPSHVQISSSIRDSGTQVTLPRSRPDYDDHKETDRDCLGRNYAINLIHKLKGSNFSLNSSNYAYSPLNSDDSDQSRFISQEHDDEHPLDTYPIDPRMVSRLEDAGINKDCDPCTSRLKSAPYLPHDLCLADTFTQTEVLHTNSNDNSHQWGGRSISVTPRKNHQR